MAYRTAIFGTVNFDGQQISYELRHVTVAEAIEYRAKGRAEMSKFIQSCVKRMDMVRDADGNEVPQDVVFRDFYFSLLVGEIGRALFSTGYVPRAVLDPSDGSSSADSTGAGSQQA